jgi:uncharacterized membrane protein YczE
MNHLPILQELLESDTLFFLIVGISIAVVMRMFLLNRKTELYALAVSAVVYAVCELLSNIHTNFMAEIILLFVGTVALGGCIGFLVSCFIGRVRRGKDSNS